MVKTLLENSSRLLSLLLFQYKTATVTVNVYILSLQLHAHKLATKLTVDKIFNKIFVLFSLKCTYSGNPQFLKSPDFLNQFSFPLDILHSNFALISQTSHFLEQIFISLGSSQKHDSTVSLLQTTSFQQLFSYSFKDACNYPWDCHCFLWDPQLQLKRVLGAPRRRGI